MATGNFPLESKHDEDGARLARAIMLIEEVEREITSYGRLDPNDNTPEDAHSDGQCRAYIGLAKELLGRCLKETFSES